MNIRVGFGFDVHRLKDGDTLILGGIKVPSLKSAVGHSDADVLIHAIIDAILGAANLRDIGYNFPDTSNEFKNIDSKILLKRVLDLLVENKWKISNIDSTVCLEKPKISAFIPEMIKSLASTLQINVNDISVKATTTEKLGFTGRQEGIAAYAVCLIEKM